MLVGMPNSSGAPLLLDTRTVAGLHTGIVCHLQELEEVDVGGRSSAGGSSGGASSDAGHGDNQAIPPATIERDPCKLWQEEEEPGLPAGEAEDDHLAAQLSKVNIGQKNSAGIFVPAPELLAFLAELGGAMVRRFPIDAAGDKIARPPQQSRKKPRLGGK